MKELIELLDNIRSALYNVPVVGEVYDQQHADTHQKAALMIDDIKLLINGTVLLDSSNVRTVLAALTGPDHHIREMQALSRSPFFENPIKKLVDQFNAQVGD